MKIKIGPLDKLFSEYIRKRAIARAQGCERCLTPKFDIQKDNGSIFPDWKQLECSHFVGRTNKGLRFDPDNCYGLCTGCHTYLGANPHEHVAFIVQKLGQDKYNLLMARSRVREKPDKEAIKLYLKTKLEEV